MTADDSASRIGRSRHADSLLTESPAHTLKRNWDRREGECPFLVLPGINREQPPRAIGKDTCFGPEAIEDQHGVFPVDEFAALALQLRWTPIERQPEPSSK